MPRLIAGRSISYQSSVVSHQVSSPSCSLAGRPQSLGRSVAFHHNVPHPSGVPERWGTRPQSLRRFTLPIPSHSLSTRAQPSIASSLPLALSVLAGQAKRVLQAQFRRLLQSCDMAPGPKTLFCTNGSKRRRRPTQAYRYYKLNRHAVRRTGRKPTTLHRPGGTISPRNNRLGRRDKKGPWRGENGDEFFSRESNLDATITVCNRGIGRVVVGNRLH